MSDSATPVTVPQLGVNDDHATLVEWHAAHASQVNAGEKLCTLETSKAVFDLDAPCAGYLATCANAGDVLPINAVIAHIAASPADIETLAILAPSESQATTTPATSASSADLPATNKARRKAEELGVNLAEVECVQGVIRERDVIHFYEHSRIGPAADLTSLAWPKDRVPIVIYGAGRGGATAAECFDLAGEHAVVAYLDDTPTTHKLKGCPVCQPSRMPELIDLGVEGMFCAIADARVRLRAIQWADELGIDSVNAVHPRSFIAPSAAVGRGNFIKAGAMIETNTRIGNACIIDNNAILPHDNVIGDGCHLAPGSTLGSSVTLGERTIIGIGASVATGVSIGRNVIVSVGSAVTRDLPDNVVAEGVPARIIGHRPS